jgi:hypothetical protein
MLLVVCAINVGQAIMTSGATGDLTDAARGRAEGASNEHPAG